MISFNNNNNNNSVTQQQHYQHPSQFYYLHQTRNEADLNDNIPPLAFDDSPETYQLLQTNSDSIQDFGDPMQSDSWGGLAQLTPKIGRFSHQRESSLSSLGSAGPASPFTQNTSNPHIAIPDQTFDGLPEMHSQDLANAQGGSYYQLAKSMGPASYQTYHGMDGAVPEMAYPVTVSGPGKRPRMDKALLPAPELAGAYRRSHPASVASSAAGDSPAAPALGEAEHKPRRKNGRTQCYLKYSQAGDADPASDFLDYGHIPKLDRTMTDVYGDELYNPNFTITSASSPPPHSTASTGSDVFSQRIYAANHQHLSAAHSPASTASRARSPFRTGSPFAASSTQQFNNSRPASGGHSQHAQHSVSNLEGAVEPETPKTISPKDAVLEFNESEGDGVFPLFPHDSSNFEIESLSKSIPSDPNGSYIGPNMVNLHSSEQFGYLPSQMPTGIQVPQQYPFIARTTTSHDTPPRLSSSGASSVASGGNTPASRGRPTSTGTEAGTYTCTYHGCTMRFETPSLLQKHKREGHRQSQGLGAPRVQDMGMMSGLANTQAGPHRCDRINPSTGKPCSTVFSRPYDLTRHEDTIHNARKQKVRCNLCTEEKTFSRADALTRHYRVCHPDMELPGKGRRRG
ncbi:26S proteasome regulatory subunit-like protein [Pochonia chlamydosporia 170]|uniref:26S proteasome regulatory subunit-like protein n=1 Tax=Pochonia chlamydosporia 170 TaxID=1380566 RepID=A0A179FZX3_METCM|nr:26S proteasome regulatory subunit-like protein [Pochonia chlamydosporia 170]OAQ71162.2 26S proteasome regulatory subunit-like protein [Pochonia chlamydosporia 170]